MSWVFNVAKVAIWIVWFWYQGSWQNLLETGPVRRQRGGYFLANRKSQGGDFLWSKKSRGAGLFSFWKSWDILFLEPEKSRGEDFFWKQDDGAYTFFALSSIFLSSISRTHTWVWVLTPSLTNPCMNPYSIYNNSLYESSLHLLQLPVWVLTPSITTPCTSPHSIYNNSLYESSLHL